jgi:hypothetical protein
MIRFVRINVISYNNRAIARLMVTETGNRRAGIKDGVESERDRL